MSSKNDVDDRSISPGNRLASLAISAVLTLVAGAAILKARTFPSTGLEVDVGAGRFPILFAGLLIALCAILVVDTLRRPIAIDPEAPSAAEIRTRMGNVAAGLAALVVGVLAIEWIGYVAATFLYLLVAVSLMGFRRLVWTPVVCTVLTAALWAAFSLALNVPLPVGALFE